MTRPEAVVFDIGNVLIEWQPLRFYDRVLGEAARRELFKAVDLDGMNLSVDRGADFGASVAALADRHPEHREAILMWRDNWLEMCTPVIDHSVRLLSALRARGVPVFALTNFGAETFEIARARYAFLNDFDRHYVSAHLQVMKPEPRIYEIVEEDCGLAPEALLFADDRPENIAAAQARGWRGHLFEGPAGWAERLVSEGLLTAEEAA
ncbi:HAD family hydrolase [Solirhodobacter olei]|uniref:HAD family hydrolase n=1 Tax=Solirhodobacter olei TaxID=2493082 RepID=UPI000FD7B0CB|nr:HAD family phosphatase [Solirhodobacter olei]